MHTHKRSLQTLCAFFSIVLMLAVAVPAQARTRSTSGGFYSSSIAKKVKALDEDKVETFAIPVLFGIKLTNMSPNFGDPRDGGARTHEGEDMLAPLGTPIVSPTPAVVLMKGSGDSSGNYVRTANPGGETFVYMHLDSIPDIKSGDVLKTGDFIGIVGDTGNAKGGPAHLHFEVRDGREATDPFPRIKKEFTLKEKMAYVTNMVKHWDEEQETAEFLVKTYKKDFTDALNAGYPLPKVIEAELSKLGIVSTAGLTAKLQSIVASIPTIVIRDLTLGSQGSEVSLVQFYLIFNQTGPAATTLAKSGATGYFGPATQAALTEYQIKAGIVGTGVYDAATRKAMVAK